MVVLGTLGVSEEEGGSGSGGSYSRVLVASGAPTAARIPTPAPRGEEVVAYAGTGVSLGGREGKGTRLRPIEVSSLRVAVIPIAEKVPPLTQNDSIVGDEAGGTSIPIRRRQKGLLTGREGFVGAAFPSTVKV